MSKNIYFVLVVVLLSCTLAHCSSGSGSEQGVCPFEQLHRLWNEGDESTMQTFYEAHRYATAICPYKLIRKLLSERYG